MRNMIDVKDIREEMSLEVTRVTNTKKEGHALIADDSKFSIEGLEIEDTLFDDTKPKFDFTDSYKGTYTTVGLMRVGFKAIDSKRGMIFKSMLAPTTFTVVENMTVEEFKGSVGSDEAKELQRILVDIDAFVSDLDKESKSASFFYVNMDRILIVDPIFTYSIPLEKLRMSDRKQIVELASAICLDCHSDFSEVIYQYCEDASSLEMSSHVNELFTSKYFNFLKADYSKWEKVYMMYDYARLHPDGALYEKAISLLNNVTDYKETAVIVQDCGFNSDKEYLKSKKEILDMPAETLDAKVEAFIQRKEVRIPSSIKAYWNNPSPIGK